VPWRIEIEFNDVDHLIEKFQILLDAVPNTLIKGEQVALMK